jgi:hypothetical protein
LVKLLISLKLKDTEIVMIYILSANSEKISKFEPGDFLQVEKEEIQN